MYISYENWKKNLYFGYFPKVVLIVDKTITNCLSSPGLIVQSSLISPLLWVKYPWQPSLLPLHFKLSFRELYKIRKKTKLFGNFQTIFFSYFVPLPFIIKYYEFYFWESWAEAPSERIPAIILFLSHICQISVITPIKFYWYNEGESVIISSSLHRYIIAM